MSQADMMCLQRSIGNTAIAGALHPSHIAVPDLANSPDTPRDKPVFAPELTRLAWPSVRRKKGSGSRDEEPEENEKESPVRETEPRRQTKKSGAQEGESPRRKDEARDRKGSRDRKGTSEREKDRSARRARSRTRRKEKEREHKEEPGESTKRSRELLTALAIPQVKPGPAIDVQKELVASLESRLAAIIASDAETQRDHNVKLEAYNVAYAKWKHGKRVGEEPKLPELPTFGTGRTRALTAEAAGEFTLGGILIDALPGKRESDTRLYKRLASAASLVPLDSTVPGANSLGFGSVLPELVAGHEHLVIENTLKTMIDAGQLEYLRAAGLPNDEWKILVEVHYIRARPKDMAGFHKDTRGQTLFVNLNYHAGKRRLRGPEFVLNPPPSQEHDEQIYGTRDKPGTLPAQFTKDLSFTRRKLGDPTEIQSSGTVQPYGYVAFVDEAIHHATPFFEHRYVTPVDFKGYLERTDGKKLAEITRRKGKPKKRSIIGDEGEVIKWRTWWGMITRPEKDRYTRSDFTTTMKGEEFDRMLANVGAQEDANRQSGAAGGWYAASIPGAGLAPLRPDEKPPLVRQASNPDLAKTWPKQLPENVPRRFFRTWVRAVPEAMAERLRKLS
jgi:hypothetical protein